MKSGSEEKINKITDEWKHNGGDILAGRMTIINKNGVLFVLLFGLNKYDEIIVGTLGHIIRPP